MRRLLAVLAVYTLFVLPAAIWATGSLTTPNVIFTQPNPVPTSKLDANWTAHANYINAREISFGVLSSRPVPGTAGRYYFATDTLILYADNGTSWTQLSPAVNAVNASARASLTLANNGTATQTFLVFPGAATSDDSAITDRVLISLTTTYTKKLTSWAVGTGLGCLDTGSAAAFTFYHIFVIQRVDTGVVDVLCSASATSPTMPTNYTKKQRLGAIRTTWFGTPGSELYFFTQTKNRFLWATPSLTNMDVSTATPGAGTDNVATVSVPNGVITKALMMVFGANTSQIYVSPLNVTAQAPGGASPYGPISCASFGGNGACQVQVLADPSSRIRYNNAANVQTQITTYGWEELWD